MCVDVGYERKASARCGGRAEKELLATSIPQPERASNQLVWALWSQVVDIQATSFHTANPVDFLNAWTLRLLRAEVIDALNQKTKYSDPARFKLLVGPCAGTVAADSAVRC
jgi:hypothetical protein